MQTLLFIILGTVLFTAALVAFQKDSGCNNTHAK